MATLKELAASAQLVAQEGLEKALTELKNYIDTQDASGAGSASAAIQAVQDQLNALVGAQEGDADKVLNTFNEIKAFLADYSEDDTLKSLIDAVNTAITAEQTRATTAEGNLSTAIATEKSRAEGAEGALSGRITTLENVEVMTAAQAKTVFDKVFNPTPAQGD